MRNYCPECRKWLGNNARRCTCGWSKPKPASSPALVDHRCHYALNGRRCPLLGTMSNYTHGSGPKYCAWHCDTYNEPVLAEAALRYVEENYDRIIEERRPWQDKLMEASLQSMKRNFSL